MGIPSNKQLKELSDKDCKYQQFIRTNTRHYFGEKEALLRNRFLYTSCFDLKRSKGENKEQLYAPGDWIYLSYGLSNSCKPITNLLIYESNKEESWTTKEITHNNITALYHRLSVNLNKNAGGKYLYVCYTYDTQFDPLTKLDVIVDDNNTIRSPHWSGVRVVRENNYSVDSYADANEGLRYGDTVHIMQTRKEIM